MKHKESSLIRWRILSGRGRKGLTLPSMTSISSSTLLSQPPHWATIIHHIQMSITSYAACPWLKWFDFLVNEYSPWRHVPFRNDSFMPAVRCCLLSIRNYLVIAAPSTEGRVEVYTNGRYHRFSYPVWFPPPLFFLCQRQYDFPSLLLALPLPSRIPHFRRLEHATGIYPRIRSFASLINIHLLGMCRLVIMEYTILVVLCVVNR